MTAPSASLIIATRVLTVQLSERKHAMPIRIFTPTYEQVWLPESDASDWICRYEIEWPEGIRKSRGHGIDAFQALHLTLQKIGIELYASSYHRDGQLCWKGQGDGYGFPVMKNARHLLVGDDAKYDA